MKGFDEYYDEAVEPGKRERAFAWATAIGLQDVDGLKRRGSDKNGEWYFEDAKAKKRDMTRVVW